MDRSIVYGVLMSAAVMLAVDMVCAQRGGGRGGSGSRSGAVRGSYRSGYQSSSGVRYATYTSALAAGYVIHGMTSYRSRYYGTSHYREDPNICSNLDNNMTFVNNTGSSSEMLKFFICPYDEDDEPGDIYCCGADDEEFCCSFWESPPQVSEVIGGLVGFVLLMAIVTYMLYRRRRIHRRRQPLPTVQIPLSNYPDPSKVALLPLQQYGLAPPSYEESVMLPSEQVPRPSQPVH